MSSWQRALHRLGISHYLIALIFGCSYPSIAAAGQSSHEIALQALLAQCKLALEKDDAVAFSALLSQPPATQQAALPSIYFAFPEKYIFQGVTVRKIAMTDTTASVQLMIECRGGKPEKKELQTLHRTLQCVLMDNTWKVKDVEIEELTLTQSLLSAQTKEERDALLKTHTHLLNTQLLEILLQAGLGLYQQGKNEGAITALTLSQQVAIRLNDLPNQATALITLGAVYAQQAKLELALEYFQRGKALAEQAGFAEGHMRGAFNAGVMFYRLAHLGQAESHFREALKLARQIGRNDFIANSLHSLGGIYHAQGDLPLALEQFTALLTTAQKLGNAQLMAKAYLLRSTIHLAQSEWREAIKNSEQVLSIAAHSPFTHEELAAYNNLGLAYEAQHQYDLAIQSFQGSLRLAQKRGDRLEETSILSNLGNSYRLQGNAQEALVHLQQAIQLAQTHKLADHLWKAQTRAARAYRALGKLPEAETLLRAAMSTVERVQEQASHHFLTRQRALEGRLAPWYEMAELQISQQNIVAAFAWIQKAKARSLLQALQRDSAAVQSILTPTETQRELALRREVERLTELVKQESKNKVPSAPNTEAQLKQSEQQYQQLLGELDHTHPELKMLRGEIAAIEPNQLKQLIPDPDIAILEYIIADDTSYLFVITQTTTEALQYYAYPIATTRQELQQRVEQLRQRLANKDFSYQELSRHLFQLLIQPAAQHLQGKRALLIVPDASLWEMPFQALLAPNDQFLIAQHAITIIPSLPVFNEMVKLRIRQQAVPPNHQLLAIGNPRLAAGHKSSPNPLMSESLAPLPEAERQVLGLQKIYGVANSRIYLGSQAQEHTIRNELSQYRILHFATHGMLDDQQPLQSRLLLASPPPSVPMDGVLEAKEILGLRIPADLAVLSACETARGRIGTGEGMIGLSWALLVAGCPTVVVSQWKLESKSTADLMLRFHGGLKGKLTKKKEALPITEALRQAALALIHQKEYAHPFYWAGFTVIGDGLKQINR